MGASVLRAHQLVRRFGNITALDNLSIDIHAGERVALFGANGAGKSTLLRIAATLTRPTSGLLEFFGDGTTAGRTRARRRIGFLSHASFLYPDLTPIENLQVYARLYRIPDAMQRIGELLERTGVVGWAHRPLRTLSRGLEQRCAVARVLLHEPELLLLDEPFSGLDAGGTAMLVDILAAAHNEGRAIVLSTHDVEVGLQVSDRAVLLRRGAKVWDDALAGPGRDAFRSVYHSQFRPAARVSHA